MTDAIELPPEPTTPPLIISLLPGPCEDCIIDFNAMPGTELRIPLEIRNGDPNETLKVRWQVITNSLPTPGTYGRALDYECPEKYEVRGESTLFTLALDAMKFPRNSCSRVDVAVSSSFRSCTRDPLLFAVTTTDDDEAERAIKSFWVNEISLAPESNPQQAIELQMSCPRVRYSSLNPNPLGP